MNRAAWILGITGQDGSYLAELLLEKGYSVWATYRHTSSSTHLRRIQHLLHHPRLFLRKGDLLDQTSLRRVVRELEGFDAPRVEVYNLAAQSFVEVSFHMPDQTIAHNCVGLTHLLEVLRDSSLGTRLRIYQASSSEMYGKVVETPQTETTPFYPRSPYGVSKVFGYWMVKNYRESYGMYISNGILFNHESPRRGDVFVTRKISLGVARIVKGDPAPIELGNLDAKRDWGHAKDYVEGMWRILQHPTPDDWVLSSQETHSVREFVEKAFAVADIPIVWKNDEAIRTDTGGVVVKVNPQFFRPAEVDLLLGDSSRARSLLGWAPTYSFDGLVRDMVLSDLQ